MLKTINDTDIRRYIVLTILTISVFSILIIKFFHLQVAQHKKYKEKANVNSIRIERLSAPRGSILDRNGKIIVDNAPTYILNAVPNQIKNIDSTLFAVSELLNIDTSILKNNYNKNYRGYFSNVRIVKDLTLEQILKVEEHRSTISGIEYSQIQERHYLKDINGSHFLGYVIEVDRKNITKLSNANEYRYGDQVGWQGLEKSYESYLKDKKGVEYKAVDAYGRSIGEYSEREKILPKPGNELISTIDVDLQAYIEKLTYGRRGCIIVGDPKTGEIISYVNSPTYPPDLFTGATSIDDWNKILNDPDKPLMDRNAKGLYPPGSTLKMVVLAYILENNLVSPNHQVYCTGKYQYGNRSFGCWNETGHGYVNLDKALIESCDVYFYQMIQDIPLNEWAKLCKEFGFGSKTGVDLPTESRGVVPDEEYYNNRFGKRGWTSGVKLNIAIGQGETLVTPLQLFSYINLIYSHGKTFQPHFALNSNADELKVDNISVSTWNRLNRLLHSVVLDKKGTGRVSNPNITGLDVAGKTGTAENSHGDPHAWFIGYAEKDGISRSFVILLENAGHGGDEAAPTARKILNFIYTEKPDEISNELVELGS